MTESVRSDPSEAVVQGYLIPIDDESRKTRLKLYEVIRNAMQYRKVGLLVVFIFLLAGALLAYFLPPTYRSEILLSAAQSPRAAGALGGLSNELGGLAALAGINFGSGDESQYHVAILRSRDFTLKFIAENELMSILFASKWDIEADDWKRTYQYDIPTSADAFKLFDEEIRSVREDRRTGLYLMSIDWSDRHVAARWANAMIAQINNHLRERDISEATRSVEFLKSELSITSNVELQLGINRLIQTQIEIIMLAEVRQEYAFRVLDTAAVADADDSVWPNKILFLLASLFVGFIVALVTISILMYRKSGANREWID